MFMSGLRLTGVGRQVKVRTGSCIRMYQAGIRKGGDVSGGD